MYRALFSFVVLGFINVCGQYLRSPCPNYFEYRNDGNGVYGAIKLQPFGPVPSLLVRANFTIATRLPSTYAGSIHPVGSELQLLQEFNRGVPLEYRVNFPISSPVPKLTAITVNDNVICYGSEDPVGQGQFFTTISLQHMLFFRSGVNSMFPVNSQSYSSHPEVMYISETPSKPSSNPTNFNFIDTNKEDTRKPDGQTYYLIDNRRPVIEPTGIKPASEYAFNNPNIHVDIPKQPSTEPPKTTTTLRTTTARPQTTRPQPLPQADRFSINFASTSTQECGISARNDPNEPGVALIVKGETFERGEWPWLVAIFKRKFSSLTYICSGTLVSDLHVITAAHCMRRKNSFTAINNIVIRAGVHNIDDWNDDDITVTRGLSTASIHKSYNASTLANDLLVLTLSRTIPFSQHIRPACLWRGNTHLKNIVGKYGVVAGWGANEMGPGGKGEPRMVEMPVVSTETCRSSKPEFHKLTSSKTLCAGDHTGSGPCLGDSGGGLYILHDGRWRLRGVVSLSLWAEDEATCNLNDYIVFTDTAQYLPWINTVISTR